MAIPDVRMLHEFRERMDRHNLAPSQRGSCSDRCFDGAGKFAKTVALIDSTDLPAATNGYKKIPWANTLLIEPTLARAAHKDGQSRYYVGYKKHTLRLWLRQRNFFFDFAGSLDLEAAPANRDDSV